MNIGIIGAGQMGSCLASKFIKSGHSVSIANSRGRESLLQFANGLGAEAASVEQVVADKKVIVVAIPEKNIPDLSGRIIKNLRKDAIVIDTGNYYPNLRDGIIPGLYKRGIDSLWVQEQLGVPVVKVFNSILATSLRKLDKPAGDNDRIALAVSGDSQSSKKTVCELVNELGFDAYDIGNIHESWKQQPGSPIYCRDINLAILKMRLEKLNDDPEMLEKILKQREKDEALMKADYQAYLNGLI